MKASQWHSRLPRFLQRLKVFPFLGFLITFLLSIKLLYACTQLPPITLTFMVPTPYETEAWASLIKEFQAENSDIRIDLDSGPDASNEAEQVYISDFKSEDPRYDLVYMDIIWVSKFADEGWLMNLSDLLPRKEKEKLKKELKDKFLENDVEGGYYNDKLYRIPHISDVGVLYYRKDLLKKVKEQPPERFVDLIRIYKKLQDKEANELLGYLWQGRQYEGTTAMFVEVLASYRGFWIDPKTRKVGLDKEAAIQAVKFLSSLIDKGISPPNVTTNQEAETRRRFKNSEAVFLRSWPNAWAQLNAADSMVRGNVGIKSMPRVYAGDRSRGCQGGWGFGIAAKIEERKKQAAWKAIQFFTSAAAQRKFALAGYMPSRRGLLTNSQLVKKYSHYSVLLKDAENSVLRPSIPEYAEASAILQQCLNAALKKDLTSQEAMIAAAKETRDLLKNPQSYNPKQKCQLWWFTAGSGKFFSL